MWVGSRPAILASIGSMAAGERGPGAHGRAELAKEQDGRRLAGVIGDLPVPGAGRVGGAEGSLHRGAQDGGIDATAAFEIGKSCRAALTTAEVRDAVARTESGAAAAASERFGHGRMSRESGNGSNRRRSPRPRRLKPFPAGLSLSSLPMKKGTGAARRPPKRARRPEPSRDREVILRRPVVADRRRWRCLDPRRRRGIRAAARLHRPAPAPP